MQMKSRLDKITKWMLFIPIVILVVLLLVLYGGLVLMGTHALSDPNGGGWLLFIMMLIGMVVFFLVASWVIKCILGIVAMVCYRKNRLTVYRILGIIYCVMSILESLCVCMFLLELLPDMVVAFVVGIVIMAMSVLYFIGLLTLYIISIRNAKKNMQPQVKG